jgi:hypothetical protein
MTAASIKAVDEYCRVANWDDALSNCRYEDERQPWTEKRDKHLAKLRAALAKTTKDEFLRGRWDNTPMAKRIEQWDRMVERAAGP